MIPTDARLLRLTVRASDRWRGVPLDRAVVEAARSRNLAGASVFPAELGFGADHRLHDAASEYDTSALPVVIEIVDAPERIDALLAELRPMIPEGLATIEPVRVLRYRHHEDREGQGAGG